MPVLSDADTTLSPRLPVRRPSRGRWSLLLALLAACADDGKSPDRPDEGEEEEEEEERAETGETGEDPESLPLRAEPWLREELDAPGSITFNELHYHPASDDEVEWIELHNPMALDMDLSGWALEDGVSYTFPEGTVLAAGGYLVVATEPGALSDATALGPLEGRLNNGGERVTLRNPSGRLIDTLAYGTDDPWPVAPDGSGLTLSKSSPDAASDHAESWTFSAELGGTPGAENGRDPDAPDTVSELVALDATWAYDLSGDYPASDWTSPDYDDSGWARAQAIFYAGEAEGDVLAAAWATADNYYGLYLGEADGTDLRLVGEDPDGDWTTVDGFDLELTPRDHLFIAAWEASGDSGSPQMTIAEVELSDGVLGTDAATFEWVLGPTDGLPGLPPAGPPPAEDELILVIAEADATGAWDVPGVDAARGTDPWGWAVSGSFSDAARFIWADTFSSSSVTNTENTYALFRSVEPVLGLSGSTELSEIPTTALFRTSFSLDADPAATTLSLSCVLDDGAVVYLNGVEVHRENLAEGAVVATTLAQTAVTDGGELDVALSADALVRGENVLAVELHQAADPDLDLRFGCALSARVSPGQTEPTLVLNELAAATEDPFWVELSELSGRDQDTSGLVLASSSGGELVLPDGSLEAGGLLHLDALGFDVEPGDVLVLYAAGRSAVLDAARVTWSARAREEDGGAWRTPDEPTPGEPNRVTLNEDIVISEILYHHAPRSVDGEPVTDDPEEWIELYNRGAETVDLGGWQLVDAVAFEFPSGTTLAPGAWLVVAHDAAALSALYPDIDVLGDLDGRLDNSSDRILLLDAAGNPADEVRYTDDGRWPSAADGGGSSLELRDVYADNAAAESWAASDETARAGWVEVSYRGEATSSAVGPDGTWEEIVLGLLDAGEVLLDDLSVIRDPDTAPTEIVQNGGFEDGGASWRLLGNHQASAVVTDPDDPSNPVLRLVATGATGHMHNHAESTLLEPVRGREYQISYRARWVSGSNQLNTRLYFNRLPNTARIERPSLAGTPGAPNTRAEDNLGPSFSDLAQDVAVPAAAEPVTISVAVADPDGVAEVSLWSSVDGAAAEARPMVEGAAGQWEGTLEGQEAGALVQFWVEAVDALGASATFPAAGPDSRALIRFDDGEAATHGLHNLRILITAGDSDWLHDDINLMSDDVVGGTVVYNESQVFYDVGVRLKGSERGRPEDLRLGYGLRFQRERPFRGSHTSALVDRSEGVGYGQREVLMNLVMTAAGSVSGEHNDLVQAITPLSEHIGPAELQLDRFSDLVLAAQFEDGDQGTVFEYELIYYPLTTDDGTAEGYKLPQPDAVVGTAITDLGSDREAYRWNFLIQSNEDQDDYEAMIRLGQAFALSDAAFLAEVGEVIDVDQWLRAFAFATLSGSIDNYGSDGSQHNAQLYVRPEDGRVLYFPHDLDFFGSSAMALVGNGDLARLIEDPANHRAYYGHLQDIIARAYNTDYLAPWCAQLGRLLPDQDIDGHCSFIDERADWILYGASDAVMTLYPSVEFQITTGGGADLSVAAREITLEGEAWLDVRQIALDGGEALELTWLDEGTWSVRVPLEDGPNTVTLVATDLHGAVVGEDTVVVTSTGG